MPRIIFLTPDELSRDPRARRAVALALRLGVATTIACQVPRGTRQATRWPPADGHAAVVLPIPTGRVTALLRSTRPGGTRRRRAIVREARGIFRLLRLARTTVAFVTAARATEKPDVVHANDLETLPAGYLLARHGRARLVYDAHEIYADQEPDPPRIHRAATARLERLLARRADAVVTVSDGIAGYLAESLALGDRPLVVLNCPPAQAAELGRNGHGETRVVYQGAMGPGRQLDDLLEAASALEEAVTLGIRVVGVNQDELRATVRDCGLVNRANILDPVEPEALVTALAGFDVGLIINRPVTRNDELVFPNKLFEYMMAGLAVVAPRLPELTTLIEGEQIGATFRPGDPADLARALDELAADRPRLEAMKVRARELASSRYNAEAQEPVLRAAWGL